MAIELSLSRPSTSTPWGFRLTGGAEYELPLIVTKVLPGTIAEEEGIQEEDVVVRINETPTAGKTHSQCHDLLVASGNNLILAIRRGDVADLYPHFAKGEYELVGNTQSDDGFTDTAFQTPDIILTSPTSDASFQAFQEYPSTPIQQRDPELFCVAKEVKTKQHKWSTFLQRPDHPPPVDKAEVEKPKSTYKVVIQKQKKKKKFPFSVEEENRKEEEEEVTVENENSQLEDNSINLDVSQEEQERSEEGQTYEEVISYNEDGSIQETEEMEQLIPESREESLESNQPEETPQSEPVEISLEDQLAEVQKQLQALSQLPTSIQDTLEAVTRQLAKIVSAKQGVEEEAEEKQPEQSSDDTHAENDLTEAIEGSIANEEQATEEISETEHEEEQNQNDEPEYEELAEEQEEEPENKEPELTEEEKEAIRIEEELMEKREKEEEFIQCRLKQRPTQALKPKSIERPIILPGGRRWSNPDDACVVRKRKMSDEKICNTIETYSEVISGRLKGINFLKYQPPPKNLDYLQKSEVYRLVHDMEPPVKGIGSRSEKILAEQDYYLPERN